LAGRKSKAQIIQPSAHLPIDLFTISHSPQFARGAKREMRDENGKLMFNARNTRMVIGGSYQKSEAQAITNSLTDQGFKNVKMKPTSLNLPSKCQSCKREGTPAITVDRRKDLLEPKLRLNYNHDSYPKTCYIGTVSLSPFPKITLKASLPIDSLGFRNRVGTYPL